jgi:predicted metal-dependent hydrolase
MKKVFIEDIEVIIEHKPRNKNSYISIDSNGVVRLKTPMKLSFRINSLLKNRLEWIREKRLHVSRKKSMKHTLGESIIIATELENISKYPKLLQMCEALHVRDEKSLERCYNRFYLQYAREVLSLQVKEVSARVGLEAKEIRFRKMKRQWGNCNSNAVITLNTMLMKLNIRQREYVIIHELCHLKYMNHSRKFYNLLNTLFPEASKIEKEIQNMNF